MWLTELPLVLAPLAGGPSTPELAAAVSNAGGLGFLAFGYLTAPAAAERLAATHALTDRPLGVNVFVPSPAPADPELVAPYVERLRAAGLDVATPRFDDDDYAAKIDLLAAAPPAVISFTFGCPAPDVVGRLQAAGAQVWVTVTSPQEAQASAAAGADVVVVQGAEAGGHSGSFVDTPDAAPVALLELLPRVHAAVGVPLVATGGLASAEAVASTLAAGAAAVQVGTAFMLAPEAGTAAAHRAALASGAPTALTRAFSGRLARGIVNAFMTEHGAHAPLAYPEIHHVTAGLRKAARERGDASLINLWAGTAHALAVPRPAAETVRALSDRVHFTPP